MIKHLSVEVAGKEQGRPNEELRGGASFHLNEHITDLQSVHVKWRTSKTPPNQLHCSQRLLASVTQREDPLSLTAHESTSNTDTFNSNELFVKTKLFIRTV